MRHMRGRRNGSVLIGEGFGVALLVAIALLAISAQPARASVAGYYCGTPLSLRYIGPGLGAPTRQLIP